MNFLVIDSESKTVDFFRIFEAWNDFKSFFFCTYRRFIISLELPSLKNKINLNMKELGFNAKCLLLKYQIFLKTLLI